MSILKISKVSKFLLIGILFLFSAQVVVSCSKDKAVSNAFPGDVMSPWEGGPAYYSRWKNGPSDSEAFFPIAVWLQNPENAANAEKYKAMGFNIFIGLHKGPTEAQLAAVANRSLTTFCDQNDVALTSAQNGVIKGWIQIDEPDNAVSGTQNPVPTETIIASYNQMKSKDNSRPVFLGLGQGVAADTWYGRGNRTNHPEDYPVYAQGGDIVCYDIYPMNVFDAPTGSAFWKLNYHNAVKQKPWLVAYGLDRLREWTNYKKAVWVTLECTNFTGSSSYVLTPDIVKAEVWMSLIHGARGIQFFVHTITPFVEPALLNDPLMVTGITAINNQVSTLAPVLNTQSVQNGFTVVSENAAVNVDGMLKRLDGYTYLFAVSMRPGNTKGSFVLRDFVGERRIEVLGENRSIQSSNGVFTDLFSNYGVHIYKIKN
jgi:hypothetical protein